LLFRSEEHLDNWCAREKTERGAVLTLEEAWRLAEGWYHDRMRPDWERKTREETRAFFEELGLAGPFWDLG
jgi:hypothetical protein